MFELQERQKIMQLDWIGPETKGAQAESLDFEPIV